MVIYMVKETAAGHWSVCRLNLALFKGLGMTDAIKLARELARDEYLRSGRETLVEMPGPHTVVRLARYARPPAPAPAPASAPAPRSAAGKGSVTA